MSKYNGWNSKDLVEILEHDGVPVCEASVTALVQVLEARAEFVDEQELDYLESQMLSTFSVLMDRKVGA